MVGKKHGRLSDEPLHDFGRRVPIKLPHELDNSLPKRFIDGHLITDICDASGLKHENTQKF